MDETKRKEAEAVAEVVARLERHQHAEASTRRKEAEASTLRKEAEAALRLEKEGRHDEAIARVDELAAKHPESALVAHLAGQLHHLATGRNLGVDSVATKKHLASARSFYILASQLAPNCIEIATGLALVRFGYKTDDLADQEIRRAVGILCPTDPAENSVWYDLDGNKSSPEERVKNAREEAARWYSEIMSFMSRTAIPRSMRIVFDIAEREGAARGLKAAKAYAERFDYSLRAGLTHAYMNVEFVRGLAPNIDKRPFLLRILDDVNKLLEHVKTSLVGALLRGKIFFLLGMYDMVEVECHMTTSIVEANDPADEDVPPGSVPGETFEERESFVCSEVTHLLQKLISLTRDHWVSLPREKRDSFLMVGFNRLKQYYADTYDETHTAAKTISDALSYVKKSRSWRFWICPYCVGKKMPNTDSLLQHMRNKHPDRSVWPKLLSVLGPRLSDDTSQRDYFMDDVAIRQDAEEHYIFQFKSMDNVFRYLLILISEGYAVNSLSEIREYKCKQGIEILEKIKLKLKNVPRDNISAEFEESCPEIQDMWHNFLEISALDYRQVITPHAVSFIWDQLLKCLREDKEASSKSIDAADFDALFPNVDDVFNIDQILRDVKDAQDAHDRNAADIDATCANVGYHPPDSNATNVDATCPNIGDAPDSNAADIDAVCPNVGDALYSDAANVDAICPNNGDAPESSEDFLLLHLIIQAIWNFRPLRDDLLKRPPACFQSSHDGSCVADLLYEIFSAREKNDHQRIAYSLTSLKANLCQIVNDNSIFQKLHAGKSFPSDILAIVVKGLHMSEASLHFCFDDKIQGQVVNPITCEDCICRAHDIFGMSLLLQMSCRCGACFDEKEYTTVFRKLYAGSPQTTKIKSFADFPVLFDVKLGYDDKCQSCGNLKNIDHFLSKTPHFFTVDLNCVDGSESHVSLSDILVGISTCSLNITLLHKDVDPSTQYTLASVICCSDERYVCISCDQNKWLIYDNNTTETEDSWESVLQRLGDSKLRPEVLFFEVIKSSYVNKDQKDEVDLKQQNIMPSCSDDTLKTDGEEEESEVYVEDENSGTTVDETDSHPSTEIVEHRNKLNGTELCEVHVEDENSCTTVDETDSNPSTEIVEHRNKLNGTELCEVHVEDENSGTTIDEKDSHPPTEIVEYRNILDGTELCEVHVEDENSGTTVDEEDPHSSTEIVEYGNKLNGTELCEVHVEDENSCTTVDETDSHPSTEIVEHRNKLNGTELCEVHVEDENSGTTVDEKDSHPPTEIVEYGNKLDATPENMEADLRYEGASLPTSSDQIHSTENTVSDLLGKFDPAAEEMARISCYQKSVDVLRMNSADEDLYFLNVIVQLLWNLVHFRNEFLRQRSTFKTSHQGPCIAKKLYKIFSAWEKNEHSEMFFLLTDVKTTLCEIVNDSNIFQQLQVGRNFASEIMVMILEGLHKHESSVFVGTNIVVIGSACRYCIWSLDLFGIKLRQLMSCRCGEWLGEEYTLIFHKLDASPPHNTKIYSFEELPMLMDSQSNCESRCKMCSESVKEIDCFLSKGPQFFTIVLKDWLGGDERQAILSEALFGIASPLDITLLYKGVTLPHKGSHSATKYRLASVIGYVEHRYVCFARVQDKWVKYDTRTVKAVDSWGELLELYREINLQPEVLIYEVIK